MSLMLLGLAIFIGVHLVPIARTTREGLIDQLGEGGYKLAFSLTSLAGFAMLVIGFGVYRNSGYFPLWYPPSWTRHIAFTINLPIFILLLATYLPGRIKTAVKHPMLLAVKLWATAHLIANGDLGDTIIFASFLGWAVLARIAAKRREAVEGAPDRSGPVRNDIIAVVGGLALYALMLTVLHPLLIGVKLVG